MNPQLRRIQVSGEKECNFCRKSEINDDVWGDMYELDGIAVHYFCMLFSSGLKQEGEDEEGILGFLPNDLKKEIRRGEKLKCKFCKGRGASIGCIVKACKTSFHFTCGLPQGTLHRFSKSFESYCLVHKPESNIPKDMYDSDCLLCCSAVTLDEPAVWPPCCKKYIFHRACMQKHAYAAGMHHFSCPNCREQDKFLTAMQNYGVFVPDRDAQWETDGYYAELEVVYSNCDADRCLCPHGRKHDEKKEKNNDKRWEIVRCNVCAAKAVHFQCGNLKFLKWKCKDCLTIITRVAPVVIAENEILTEESCVSCGESVSSEGDDCNANRAMDLNKIRSPFDFISNRPHIVTETEKMSTLTFNNSILHSAVSEWASKLRQTEKNSPSSVVSTFASDQLKERAVVDQSRATVISESIGSGSFKQKLENLRRSCKANYDEENSSHSSNLASENVALNMQRALKRFCEEKNVDSSERDTKTLTVGVKLPRFAKTTPDIDPSKVLKVDKVTLSSLSSKSKALAAANKMAPLPVSKATTVSDEVKNPIVQKLVNKLQVFHSSGDQHVRKTSLKEISLKYQSSPRITSNEVGREHNIHSEQFPTVECDGEEIMEIPLTPLSGVKGRKRSGDRVETAHLKLSRSASGLILNTADELELSSDDSDIVVIDSSLSGKSKRNLEVEIIDLEEDLTSPIQQSSTILNKKSLVDEKNKGVFYAGNTSRIGSNDSTDSLSSDYSRSLSQSKVSKPSFTRGASSSSPSDDVILSSDDEDLIILTSTGEQPSTNCPKGCQAEMDVDLLDIPAPDSSSTFLCSEYIVPHDILHNRRARRNLMNSNRSDNYLADQLTNPIYFNPSDD